MTRFTYVFIGLMAGGMGFLTSTLFGGDLAAMVMSLPASTHPGLSPLAGALVGPLTWLLLNPVWGGVVIGVAWPVALFWVALTGAIGMIGAGYEGATALSFDLGLTAFF